MDDLIKEFLLESGEGLDHMERSMAALSAGESAGEHIAAAFRSVHTIKGTVGFFGFPRLERLAHAGEALLTAMRTGGRTADTRAVALLVRLMDRLRHILQLIETTGAEGLRAEDEDRELVEVLQRAADGETLDESLLGAIGGAVTEELGSARTAAAETTLRVDVNTLNRLMHLVGELVQTRNQILQSAAGAERFARLGQKLDSVTGDLRETVMQARMQPVAELFQKFPRLVREVAQSCGKRVRLEYQGGETRLDKSLLEALKDPVTHAIRNAIDHGIEPLDERLALGKSAEGVVTLKALQEGSFVVLEVSDDGGGIALEAVLQRAVQRGLVMPERAQTLSEHEAMHFVFAPGFSTRDEVTLISGRGVGMDVVRANVERAGGSVELHTVAGRGTTLRLRVPLTLAIVPALIASCGGEMFAIPRSAVQEMVAVWRAEQHSLIRRIGNARMLLLRGRLIPLLDTGELLGLRSNVEKGLYIAVLEAGGKRFGLVVDDMADPQEIVVRPLARMLRQLDIYAGATVLGDGSIALIFDVNGLARKAGLCGTVEHEDARAEADAASAPQTEPRAGGEQMLMFLDHAGNRSAIPLARVERIETLVPESVETIAGQAMMQHRGGLVMIDDPGGLLRERSANAAERTVLICFPANASTQRTGLLVRQVLDVGEAEHLPVQTIAGKTVARVSGKLTAIVEPVHSARESEFDSSLREVA